MTLSFYDFHRQDYYPAAWLNRHDIAGDFEIGGLIDGGGVDERGEFKILLHDFDNRYGGGAKDQAHFGKPLNVQICVFDDAFGALREAIDACLLNEIEATDFHSRDDLTKLLVGLGFKDVSHKPMAVAS